MQNHSPSVARLKLSDKKTAGLPQLRVRTLENLYGLSLVAFGLWNLLGTRTVPGVSEAQPQS